MFPATSSTTSIKVGALSKHFNASPTHFEYSLSNINIFASLCFKIKPTVCASNLVLILFRTAPDIGTPKWHSHISGMLGNITDTVSFLVIPLDIKALANKSHLLEASAYERLIFPYDKASWYGKTRLVLDKKEIGLNGW